MTVKYEANFLRLFEEEIFKFKCGKKISINSVGIKCLEIFKIGGLNPRNKNIYISEFIKYF